MREKVHFMGIAGSGLAPIAIIAKSMGFDVTGCDISDSTYYAHELKNNGIDIQVGHSADHLKDADILAITPAVYDYNPDHPELLEGQRRGIVMTWQEFSGKYLQKDKKVVAICGTHGKSSTTALTGLMMEHAGLDPIVEAGTIIREWGAGYRLANSDYFVVEADEFNNNFLNYHPSYIIFNNMEMDHPEFFKDEDEIKQSYVNFIKNMVNEKLLIVNFDNPGTREILEMAKDWILENGVTIAGYCKDKSVVPAWTNADIHTYEIKKATPNGSIFVIDGTETCEIGILGDYNVQNAMGVYCLSKALNVEINNFKETIKAFHGIGRRMEKKYEDDSITIYDDYGHHPTEIAAVFKALKDVYTDKTVVGIFEPHQISRLKLFVDEFVDAFKIPDVILVTKTFEGREARKHLTPMDMNILKDRVGDSFTYIEDFDDLAKYVKENYPSDAVIIVCGAGYSYKLTEKLVDYYK